MHKITAIRMEQHKDVITLTGLTQSPRGTRVILKSVKTPIVKTDRKKRRDEIQSALAQLLGSGE